MLQAVTDSTYDAHTYYNHSNDWKFTSLTGSRFFFSFQPIKKLEKVPASSESAN